LWHHTVTQHLELLRGTKSMAGDVANRQSHHPFDEYGIESVAVIALNSGRWCRSGE
jgi:hypothetical protein